MNILITREDHGTDLMVKRIPFAFFITELHKPRIFVELSPQRKVLFRFLSSSGFLLVVKDKAFRCKDMGLIYNRINEYVRERSFRYLFPEGL